MKKDVVMNYWVKSMIKCKYLEKSKFDDKKKFSCKNENNGNKSENNCTKEDCPIKFKFLLMKKRIFKKRRYK